MRKLIARLLLLVLLFSVTVAPGTAAAEETKQSPKVVQLQFPAAATAGAKVTFNVLVRTDPAVGVCCGTLWLTGPSGQSYMVDLQPSGKDKLSGSLELSPNAQAGTWRVTRVTIMDNEGERVTPTSTWSMKVNGAASKTPDVKAPVLTSVTVPTKATAGDAFTVTVQAKDEVSGLAYGYVRLAPTASSGREWTLSRLLLPTEKPGELQSVALMEPNYAGESLGVLEVTLYDKAGNYTTIAMSDLLKNKANQIYTDARARTVPEGLVTSPYLNLIHPGPTTYTMWYGLDKRYLMDNLWLARTEPQTVRERAMAEVGQIQVALEALSEEIYTDPESGLRVSPYATTGKWMVLDRALDMRTYLLTELDRMAGLTDDDWIPLTDDDINNWYSFITAEEDFWVTLEGGANESYAEVAASWLYVLGQSPEAVKLLQTPAMELSLPNSNTFDRNLIYFVPMHGAQAYQFEWGSASLWLPASSDRAFTDHVGNIFYELGHHLSQAYFSAADTAEESTAWAPYLQLRGNQVWQQPTGVENSPMENMGSDFAASFLPLGLDKYYRIYSQPYPYLRNNPAMMAAFKRLVADKQKTVIRPVTISPVRDTTVGLGEGPAVAVTGEVALARLLTSGHMYDRHDTVREVFPMQIGPARIFPLTGIQHGRVGSYFLRVQDVDGRPYNRILTYVRVPVLLDPVPRTTNKSSVVISGTAPAGARVSVAKKTATASATGRFTMSVPLVRGTNDLRVTVSGTSLGASFQVDYEPATTKVPVKITMPGTTSEPVLVAVGKTAPLSMVEVPGGKFQAGPEGDFYIVQRLQEGLNKIEVKVKTPAGNSGSYVGTIVYDSGAPELSANVPLQTNLTTFTVTGTTDPGVALMINETPVTVAADGSFSQELVLTLGETMPIVMLATDSAGNRTAVETSITAVSGIPQMTELRSVELTGRVPAGAALTYQGKPVTVDVYGNFSVAVPVDGGINTYRLEVVEGTQITGYLEFVVTNPLVVTTVRTEANGRLTVAGKTVPGYTVTVGGELVSVAEDGTWTVTMARPGAPVKVVATGDARSYETTVEP